MKQPTPEKPDNYQDHHVDSALETLMRAEDIKGDHKMMKLVKHKIGKKKKSIESIAELREVAKQKMNEPEGENNHDDGN